MIIFIGMVAVEFLGMLALAGLAMLGLGAAPWVLPRTAALLVAFVIGFMLTYALGRTLGLIDLGEIDTYRARVETMHEMSRGRRPVRTRPRAAHRAVVIEY